MRAIWSGALSFGLVNIPVKLFSAAESKAEINFDMLHKKDMGRIRYARVCRVDGQEIPYDDIVKGYEYQKGDYVVLTEEDFKKADVKKTSTIDVVEFVKEEEIDPMLYEKPYFLSPQKGAEKPYALLAEALKKAGKVGVAKFVLRNRESVAMITPKDDVIVLNRLRYQEELKNPEGLAPQNVTKPEESEVEMAIALIDQLTHSFEPKKFKDTYTSELKEVIEEKAQGKEFKRPAQTIEATKAQDIMKMLRDSLEQERKKQKVGR